jgi:hypothetical protein
LIHFNAPPGAEKMAHELYSFAAGALSLAGGIHNNIFVMLDFDKMFTSPLLHFINTLQFEGIEPNTAATALANVHLKVTDLPPGQFIEASWTFHGRTLPISFRRERRFNCGCHFR